METLSVCAMGAAPDTGNLGVSALSESIVSGIARRSPDADLTVFDNGWGRRRASLAVDGSNFVYSLCGIRRSRRFYRPESMVNVRLSARLGGLANPAARAIQHADLILDISGGDSFSDIYGVDRFKAVIQPKELALRQKSDLVLLPQTYGPFKSHAARQTATRILRSSASAWARDVDSYEVMSSLLGDDFDAGRHRLGVDVAFALEPTPVHYLRVRELAEANRPLVGVNVSGMLFSKPAGEDRFGLGLDYRAVMVDLVGRLVDAGAHVLLVPHVHSDTMPLRCDRKASTSLIAQLDPARREGVSLLTAGLTAGEAKWTIGHCEWFCGARMHSTIAALSSLVPTAAIGYSAKMAGVFAGCGQREAVVDARVRTRAEASEELWHSWLSRDRSREALRSEVPATVEKARAQWDDILNGAGAARS